MCMNMLVIIDDFGTSEREVVALKGDKCALLYLYL